MYYLLVEQASNMMAENCLFVQQAASCNGRMFAILQTALPSTVTLHREQCGTVQMKAKQLGLYRDVARESTSSRKMMQPGSASAALNISDSLRSLSPYHLEPIASRGTYTSGTDAWLAITLALVVLPVPACSSQF